MLPVLVLQIQMLTLPVLVLQIQVLNRMLQGLVLKLLLKLVLESALHMLKPGLVLQGLTRRQQLGQRWQQNPQ
jgi:hypothetical protein